MLLLLRSSPSNFLLLLSFMAVRQPTGCTAQRRPLDRRSSLVLQPCTPKRKKYMLEVGGRQSLQPQTGSAHKTPTLPQVFPWGFNTSAPGREWGLLQSVKWSLPGSLPNPSQQLHGWHPPKPAGWTTTMQIMVR
ncbi:hypothetical protein FQN60_003442 [Etheostoma spectabile]|uniref:Secreted protein n=1 Tax=Etheostoma spectabile TaxID=54343 RepID=A0A5J5CCE5_9PERO|nr:hypothetical protein FQN60_003442 [Etheostoma spectabile]